MCCVLSEEMSFDFFSIWSHVNKNQNCKIQKCNFYKYDLDIKGGQVAFSKFGINSLNGF